MKRNLIKLTAILLACVLLCGCREEAAVSLSKAKINPAGELVLFYSDGSWENLGVVVGKDGEDGKDGIDGTDSPPSAAGDVSAAVATGLRSAVSIFCTFQERGSYVEYYTAGSGVIYQLDREKGDAFIITNYHVVYDADSRSSNGIAQKITLYLYGGELTDAAIYATYVGGSQNYDIAVLRVENCDLLKSSSVAAVTVASSDEVRVGSTAIAIGNPEGMGISASSGVICVDSEHITMTAADNVTTVDYRVMRIDTAVNHGNSGGGLFDGQGRLIGIVNAKTIDDDVENIGYALPSTTVTAVADNIIDYCYGTRCESVRRAILGVTVGTTASSAVYDEATGQMTIRETVKIQDVTPGGIGSVFKIGDVLVSATLEDRQIEITRQHQIIELLLTARPGDTVTVRVKRGSETVDLTMTITDDCLTDY